MRQRPGHRRGRSRPARRRRRPVPRSARTTPRTPSPRARCAASAASSPSTSATRTTADRFLAALRLIVHATSFGGVHTSAERRARWGGDDVSPGLIRLSAGIEDADDLVADVLQALAASRSPSPGELARPSGCRPVGHLAVCPVGHWGAKVPRPTAGAALKQARASTDLGRVRPQVRPCADRRAAQADRAHDRLLGQAGTTAAADGQASRRAAPEPPRVAGPPASSSAARRPDGQAHHRAVVALDPLDQSPRPRPGSRSRPPGRATRRWRRSGRSPRPRAAGR